MCIMSNQLQWEVLRYIFQIIMSLKLKKPVLLEFILYWQWHAYFSERPTDRVEVEGSQADISDIQSVRESSGSVLQ